MPPDCSITPTRGRSARASATGSRPRTATVPASGRRYPSQISIVVVLPAPFGPSTAVTVPRRARRLSPSTAVVCPYRLTRSQISTAGVSLTLASLEGCLWGTAGSDSSRRHGPGRTPRPGPRSGAGRCRPRGATARASTNGSPSGAALHRLDDAVLGPRGGDQAVAERVDRLVMRGRHVDRRAVGAEDPGEPGARRDPDRVRAERARLRGVPGVRRAGAGTASRRGPR